MPLPFSGSASGCGLTGHAHAEQRRHDVAPEERTVALVIGMRDERHAGSDELRARRFDFHKRRAASRSQPDPVIRAGALAILELGLGDRRLEVDVP